MTSSCETLVYPVFVWLFCCFVLEWPLFSLQRLIYCTNIPLHSSLTSICRFYLSLICLQSSYCKITIASCGLLISYCVLFSVGLVLSLDLRYFTVLFTPLMIQLFGWSKNVVANCIFLRNANFTLQNLNFLFFFSKIQHLPFICIGFI